MLERLSDRGALVPQKPSISNFSTTKWAFSLKNVWGSTYLFPMVTYPSYAPTFSNEKRVGTNNQIRGRCRADRGLVRVTDNKTCSKNYPGGRKGKGEENRERGFSFLFDLPAFFHSAQPERVNERRRSSNSARKGGSTWSSHKNFSSKSPIEAKITCICPTHSLKHSSTNETNWSMEAKVTIGAKWTFETG